MNVKDKKEGPDGINLWNYLLKEITNEQHCLVIYNMLLETQGSWDSNLDLIVNNWRLCMRINKNCLPKATESFKLQLERILKTENHSQSSLEHIEIKKELTKKEKTEMSAKYKDIDLKTKENEITKVKYCKDIGLICTTFKGTIKIFDAFSFNQIWKNSNKNRNDQQHSNIMTFDISSALGLMATGGAEGRLVLIDPYALGVINGVIAHKNKEIINVYCYDQQQQIITVSEDRTILLWDAYRLERLQVIKDLNTSYVLKFTSSTFDKEKGMLYLGC